MSSSPLPHPIHLHDDAGPSSERGVEFELDSITLHELYKSGGPPDAGQAVLASFHDLDTSLNISYSNINIRPVGARHRKKRLYFATIWVILVWTAIAQVYKQRAPSRTAEEQEEEDAWIASSKSWWDRQACKHLGICGAAHFRTIASEVDSSHFAPTEEQYHPSSSGPPAQSHSAWTEGKTDPADWDDDERVMREVPQYVIDYAPLVHLYSAEKFWPCDIEDHLLHTTPYLNYTPLRSHSDHPNLTNLAELNEYQGGKFVFLTSNDNVEERPEWLTGELNRPNPPKGTDDISGADDDDDDDDGDTDDTEDLAAEEALWYEAVEGINTGSRFADNPIRKPTQGSSAKNKRSGPPAQKQLEKKIRGGKSGAPAVLIVVDKGHGIVDAFWFYFYSFNLGNVVLDVRFGNHVGDWEHNVVRFYKGKPQAVYFSEHSFGSAYSYDAVQKIGKRPVAYSATGSHAMYATPGVHTYILPFGLLHDITDRGPLWDPSRNMHSYRYDYITDTLKASQLSPKAPTSWFYFAGHWGDKYYPLSDDRQYRFAGQYHYVNGPVGPRWKNLGRRRICQSGANCVIRRLLGDDTRKVKRWVGVEGEMTVDDFDEMQWDVDELN